MVSLAQCFYVLSFANWLFSGIKKCSAFVPLAKVHLVVVRKLATVGDECREFVLGGSLVCR